MGQYHPTAMSRKKPSAPAQWLYDNKYFSKEDVSLDYGCGKGVDVVAFNMEGWDPYGEYSSAVHESNLFLYFDVILCTYVLNVIENEEEKDHVIKKLNTLLNGGGKAYITVRADKANLNGRTKKGTYQEYINLDLPIIRKTSSYIIYELTKNE
jgi:hypothetical protein|tara:strand:+ start:566 stop:1024 length:459 start_codon:yes stop_codon:yes gene_type:complete